MHAFTSSRQWPVAPSAVFAAIQDPVRLARWWGPDGFSNTFETFEFVPGGLVTIKIRDNGPGIPKQHLGKVFDPFYTTKGQGEGSGLGLTVAQRLIKKFGGEIRIESPEGQGTTCIITLPAEKAAVRKEEPCVSS